MKRLLPFLALPLTALAQDAAMLSHWAYDAKAPLDVKEAGVEKRGDVVIHDLSYASPKGGRVPAYLVMPKGKGPFPAVVWGHWYWDNSAMRNRTQFLDEAVLLARSGVASLLNDGTVARPGYTRDRTALNEKQFTDLVQQVVDMRRAVDVLLARGRADPKRLAFVGHSYNATVGGILAGVERRFKALVLMAGGLSDEADLKTEPYRKYREKVGPEKFDPFFAAHLWADPGRYVAHAAPAAVFMQFATKEDFLNPEHVKAYEKVVSEPKRFKMYDAPHALNAEARRDRIAFLAEQLGFRAPEPAAIAAVPDLFQPADEKP